MEIRKRIQERRGRSVEKSEEVAQKKPQESRGNLFVLSSCFFIRNRTVLHLPHLPRQTQKEIKKENSRNRSVVCESDSTDKNETTGRETSSAMTSSSLRQKQRIL